MSNVINRTAIVMYRAFQKRPLSIPLAGNGRSTRKRRISVFLSSRSGAFNQTRYFHSTLVPSSLPIPTIVYSDNHLLAVNKPAGWHSVPNIPKQGKKAESKHRIDSENASTSAITSKKCLLTHLRQKGLGGGSKNDFLVPLHRIDQPCTGILLFGKTSKAASRVTKVWKGKRVKKKTKKEQQKQQASCSNSSSSNSQLTRKNHATRRGVVKDYLCVVPTSRLGAIKEASVSITDTNDENGDEYNHLESPRSVRHSIADNDWNRLDGVMLRQSVATQHEMNFRQLQRKQQQRYYNDRLRKGRSVKIIRKHHPSNSGSFYDYDHDTDHSIMRPIHVMWKIVHVPTIESSYTLLLVRTSEGARHMVRALLAQVGECPILGDIRYWKPKRGNNNSDHDTDNEKGPLKDRSVALHAYGVYFDRSQLKLGSLDTFEFRAPVPPTWEFFFGINNEQLQNIL